MVNTISNPDLRTNARRVNTGRHRVRALTASAAAALALTAGAIAPTAGAEPADPAPAQTQHETGPAAGQVESVTATDADSITVRWKDRDGMLDDVTYQYGDGEFTVV